MRTPRGLTASAGLLLSGLLVLTPTVAAAAPGTIGGDRLATHGYVVAEGAPALPRGLVAAGWMVADLDSGDVLAAKNPHGQFAPASTLKTLTAETLIPKLAPTMSIIPTFDDVNVDGSKVGLQQHLRYTAAELFTAMLVVSGNDAANTLATANGGVPKTVEEMNAEAARLHALDTHAANANGLDDPTQLTSPYDLGLIARAAMELPTFRMYVATKHSHIRGPGKSQIAISSHDKLLYNYPGTIGIKNGFTVKARATFVGAATRGGHTLLVVLMRTAPRYWPEAASLLDWGFAATAAGVAPVGKLVDAEPRPETAGEPQAAPVRPAAARLTVASKPSSGAGLPLLPTAVLATGAAVLGGGVLRGRRRRPRRMSLPKL
ncbi:MAG: peptidase D-alanyl-D-alanine carboxypeptidase 1 [Frankiales bacterium]|nr:peptidase D-alanyl-D-alanine carboxypeptidase 1 [Frankiales bacterium]